MNSHQVRRIASEDEDGVYAQMEAVATGCFAFSDGDAILGSESIHVQSGR